MRRTFLLVLLLLGLDGYRVAPAHASGTIEVHTISHGLKVSLSLPGSTFPLPSPATRDTVTRFHATSHGSQLTVILPHRTYPGNALIRLRVTLRNVSRHIVFVPYACNGQESPAIRLTTDLDIEEPSGLQFPHQPRVMSCKVAPPRQLRPGKALHWSYHVVLRGRHIEVKVGLGGKHDYFISSWVSVHGAVAEIGYSAGQLLHLTQ